MGPLIGMGTDVIPVVFSSPWLRADLTEYCAVQIQNAPLYSEVLGRVTLISQRLQGGTSASRAT